MVDTASLFKGWSDAIQHDYATVGATTVYGIFNKGHDTVLDVESSRPSFLMADADVAANSVVRATSMIIDSSTYLVRELHPNGWGATLLIVEMQ